MQKRGRQSKFTQALAEEICEKLSKGIPLAEICRQDHMPAVNTVGDWKYAHPEFGVNFARAREEGFDAIAADCLSIADEATHDTKEGRNGELIPDSEWISRSKLRVETRLKLLAKWCPKRYGERLEHDVSPMAADALTALMASVRGSK